MNKEKAAYLHDEVLVSHKEKGSQFFKCFSTVSLIYTVSNPIFIDVCTGLNSTIFFPIMDYVSLDNVS